MCGWCGYWGVWGKVDSERVWISGLVAASECNRYPNLGVSGCVLVENRNYAPYNHDYDANTAAMSCWYDKYRQLQITRKQM